MRVKVRVSRPVWPAILLGLLILLACLILAFTRGDDVAPPDIDIVSAAPRTYSGAGNAGVSLEVIPLAADGSVSVSLEAVPVSELPSPYITVYNHRAGAAMRMTLEEYLLGVVAAEMPAAYEPEALKAQAIAARTYAYAKLISGGCSKYGADICTDSGHCQAWHTAEELRAGWGDSAETYSAKIARAVSETAGLILTYDGEPIDALFHSSSGGHTEDVENVYAVALPYLRGVESPGEEGMSGFSSQVEYTEDEFRKRAENAGCALTDAPLASQVYVSGRTAAGYVDGFTVGDSVLDGRQSRKAFRLRSASFTVEFVDGGVRFDVRGYGHGVGMSQTGANAMAREGAYCEQILHYYYTGVDISNIPAKR